jgi:hypothetical protein
MSKGNERSKAKKAWVKEMKDLRPKKHDQREWKI